MILENVYKNVVKKYTDDEKLVDRLWNNLIHMYDRPSRYYHNHQHIYNMLYNLAYIKPYIKDMETIIMSIFYHDIVYKPLSNNNEKDSAKYMKSELSKIKFPNINKCYEQILATKYHLINDDSDINYLIDLDLMCLGLNKEDFNMITTLIRNEYKMLSDIKFLTGRKHFIEKMLNRNSIFLTEHYKELLEKQAVDNLEAELLTVIRKINNIKKLIHI